MATLAVNTYDIGQAVRFTVTFADTAGVSTDPTTVTFIIRDPSGTETTYTYPPAGTIVKDDTGDYHADVTIDEAGLWYYRWTGTGVLVAAAEHGFYGRISEIV
jgi:hypothetical protein